LSPSWFGTNPIHHHQQQLMHLFDIQVKLNKSVINLHNILVHIY